MALTYVNHVVSILVSAALYATIMDFDEWSAETLNFVMANGHNLYCMCDALIKMTVSPVIGETDHIQLYGSAFKLKFVNEGCSKKNATYEQFKVFVQENFHTNDTFLVINENVVLLVRNGNKFYVFDPNWHRDSPTQLIKSENFAEILKTIFEKRCVGGKINVELRNFEKGKYLK